MQYTNNRPQPESFIGKTLVKLDEDGFTLNTGEKFIFHHFQDCCERVGHYETEGDYNSVLNSPITEFTDRGEEHPNHSGKYYESHTWTTYTIIAENGGCVKIYFLGESNGYYGESMCIISERS